MAEIERHQDDLDEALNPHREEELHAAVVETVGRLHSRGIEASTAEAPEDLVDLLTAVERFEDRVEALGGDLFVDDLNSSQPDHQRFVVPRRVDGEPLRAYMRRIEEATAQLRGAARTRGTPPS
jgi:hypothetical protein